MTNRIAFGARTHRFLRDAIWARLPARFRVSGTAQHMKQMVVRFVPPPVTNVSLGPVGIGAVGEVDQTRKRLRHEPVKIPSWYNSRPAYGLSQALTSGKPLFLYIPWIPEHTDSLIQKLRDDSYELAPLDFVSDMDRAEKRREVSRFSVNNPDVYKRMITRRLVPLKSSLKGVIFTFDWAPVMRIVSTVCEELEIPRILIPHESVFASREKYYWDVTAKASVPTADVILGWGTLQREIFAERGYPEERFKALGAPKFDIYASGESHVSRTQFANLFGLDPNRKMFLFAAQPLDSQLDAAVARQSQRDAIADLVEVASVFNAQVLVRMPPSRDDILGEKMRERLLANDDVAIDDADCYLVPAEDAVLNCDLITSINSTMLLEGVLADRPALSLKYLEFDQIWKSAGIPAATNLTELREKIAEMLASRVRHYDEGLEWARTQFSGGDFDGQAATRIKGFLRDVANDISNVSLRPSPLRRALQGQSLDVVGIPSVDQVLIGTQRYVKEMLRARTLIQARGSKLNVADLASVDVFAQWGCMPTLAKQEQADMARRLGRPIIIIEDGFLRSVDIGLSGEPALSIMLDDKTAYYDATKVSRLAMNLESDREIDAGQRQRARSAIDAIQLHRLSKYNHAPYVPLTIGTNPKKLLLVDQRYGDQSVERGLADETSFDRMISDVLRTRQDWEIIVKQHPDALKGGKESYLTRSKFDFSKYTGNIHFVDFNVNPHSLFDIVSEVYVVTSGLGFEALMAGKKVFCYGMPFYAGWGVTEDTMILPSRTKNRSIEEIFYMTYIECSRYYSPELQRACDIEDTIAFLAQKTKFAAGEKLTRLRAV